MKTSPKIAQYFKDIEAGVQKAHKLATAARQKGLDPENEVSIPLAKNMAERVVGLISVVYPKITETKVTQRIEELEKEYGMLDWRVGFKIAEEVAKQQFCEFENKQQAIEIGIRVGFAYLTLGIVSAPLEGFIGLKIKKRKDGKEYFALQYAGPIRGAGGTAASTSVILSDYVRVKMGYAPYDPDEKEVSRYTAEVHDYHDRVTNLQYHPSDDELKFMIGHLPVEVDGDPTEKIEVSNYKDLARIETNLIRGGVALVIAEGLCQKAPKLWKRLSKWGKDFDLDWEFLQDFLALKEKIHAEHAAKKEEKSTVGKDEGAKKHELLSQKRKHVTPNNTFIMDLVAGRPILTHPVAKGGFRLRYGRGRTSGFSAAAVHPATLVVLNKFIAIGTQLKMERPGKAATMTLCDTIDGPIVRLENGNVLQLHTEEEAKSVLSQVEEILFLGDILFNYGDFSENGHALAPAGYCPEWWALEVEKALGISFSRKTEDLLEIIKDKWTNQDALKIISVERLVEILQKPLSIFPSVKEAVAISAILDVPLFPNYIFFWSLISCKEFKELAIWLQEAKLKRDTPLQQEVEITGNKGVLVERPEILDIQKIILPYYGDNEKHQQGKKILDKLGISHEIVGKENIVIQKKDAVALALNLGIISQQQLAGIASKDCLVGMNVGDGLDVIVTLAPLTIRDKAGTFIGARMGRPEKAKMRTLTGSPQVMFPVGEEGDRLRSFQAAMQNGKVRSSFPYFYCENCQKDMVYRKCDECGKECVQKYSCRFCGDLDKDTCRHGKASKHRTVDVDIKYFFDKAQKRVGERVVPDLIKGVRGTSNKDHIVEHLSKGILRAKHGIYVNKDGTTRYDCTELPITHFKPKEVKTSVAKLKEIGYDVDIYGNPLEDENQVLEIKPQDVILPGYDSLTEESAPKVMKKVANFVDNLLVSFYGMDPFYNVEKEEDLVGHLVIGLAPHISAGMVGRIIGFSETQGLITNPMFHAGLRRDCDGDEAAVMMLMDALLNFSRQYLPKTRGSTMDCPLVLTSILNPTEVDDQVHGVDVMWRYPLELYEAATEMKNPWEVKFDSGKEEKQKITQLSDRLGTELQFEDFGFTHSVDNFNKGVQCSAYKTLPSMEEKLVGQMDIAQKVRAVNLDHVAQLVIQKHFLKDIKGNLRKFSMQQFRCVKCNAKFRRPPLSGNCNQCSGKLLFTISEGSVVKYLGYSLMLAEKYDFSPYLKQTLDILKNDIETVFGKEKDKQVGLASFMG